MTRHTTGHRVDGIAHLSTLAFERVGKLLDLMLSLGKSHTVTRYDDDILCRVKDFG